MSRAVGAPLLVLVAASLGSGCYQYREMSATAVRPDETVRVILTSDASSSLASTIGPNATSLDGRVVSVDSTRMRLAVTQIARAVGSEEFLQFEPIDVPTRGALTVSVRSMDRFRTVLAFGGLLAGVFAAHALTNSPGVVSTTGAPSGSTK
jgi:hypothetical protein